MRAVLLILLVAACAPPVHANDDGGPDAYGGPLRHVTGRVWMPNANPDVAAPGEEIPVFGAEVYLSRTRPDPIPQTVYCEQCSDIPSGTKYSGHDGSFDATAEPGVYWLVIQKGQFRIEQEIDLGAGDLALDAGATTLPSVNDPANGRWMPKIAIALGTNDNIEDVLGKLGVGEYDPATYTFTGGGAEVTVFDDPAQLLGDLDTLRQFHIVFFPCSVYVDDYTIPGMDDQSQLDNLRHYVAEGGRLYITDWSGDMIDHAFPPQLELGDPGVDTTGTYDPQLFGGTLATIGDSDGTLYDATDAEVVDDDLAMWLGLQTGPTPDDPTPSLFDPSHFAATDNWNWLKSLTSVQTGVDDQGLPIYDDPKPWVVGSGPSTGGVKQPLTVTFQPTGCGRVMFSTYQTANGHHPGLYPQERILLYLIMEIAVCSDNPVVQ